VFKASVKLHGSVVITAAIKTLKSHDESGRTELLREAALMALFEHPNLVHLMGVVTAPRNMPGKSDTFCCSHRRAYCKIDRGCVGR
jgi:hypothetical protein